MLPAPRPLSPRRLAPRRPVRIAALLLLIPAALSAADTPLAALPSDAGVVLRVSAPASLARKLKGFAANALPPFVGVVDQLPPAMGSLISNPTLAGVDAKRDWYVAILPRKAKPPVVLFAAPASDAAKLKAAVGEDFTFADYENWVVYSKDADAVAAVGKNTKTSAASAMISRCGDLLAAGELAGFVNVPALREVYAAEFARGRDEAMKALDKAANPAGGPATPALTAQTEFNKKLIGMAFDAVGDLTGFAFTVGVSDDAVTTQTVAVAREGSATAAFLAAQTPGDFPLLDKLPADLPVYFAGRGALDDLTTESIRLTAAMYGLGPQQAEKLVSEFRTIELKQFAGGLSIGDANTGAVQGINIWEAEPAAGYLAVTRRLMKSMTRIEQPGLQQDIAYREAAETIAGVEVDVMTAKTTFDPSIDPTGMMRTIFEVAFGRDGMTQRLAVVDGLYLQAIGGPAVMERAVAALRGQAAAEKDATLTRAAIAAARGTLSDKANVLVLADLPRLAAGLLRIAAGNKSLPLKIDAAQVDALALPPEFLGFTLTAGPDELRYQGVLPAGQLRGLFDVFMVVQQSAPR